MIGRLRSLLRPRGKKSYAQSGEDLIADYLLRIVLQIPDPYYLDVGTNDPVDLNNTYLFYRAGGHGVCVEPDPLLAARIARARPRDRCLNLGVGEVSSDSARFWVMDPPTLSTFSEEQVRELEGDSRYRVARTIDVPLLSLTDIIAEHCARCPQFVSIDVEGLDLDIVRGFDFDRFRPEVFCIESVTHVDEIKIDELIRLMRDRGYVVYADTFINTLFVEGQAWARRQR
ncbi:MAG: FkbM family methyltransferase [bacterium]|nr:FkbM family methyltransferase [bacterium]